MITAGQPASGDGGDEGPSSPPAAVTEIAMIGGLVSPVHLLIILAIVLIVFGPGRLPDIGPAFRRGRGHDRTNPGDDAQPACSPDRPGVDPGEP